MPKRDARKLDHKTLEEIRTRAVEQVQAGQRPLWRAWEQDPKRVERWRQQEYPAIRVLAKRSRATLLFGDEAGVRSDYHAGTTWGVRGQTPVVPTTGQRFGLNLISAVSARGGLRFMVVKGTLNGSRYVQFLKRLMHNASRPVFLIVDGHPVHKSRAVRAYVAATEGKLRLFYLPPYSPELNPDEQVWNHVKHHGVGRAVWEGTD